MSRLIRVVRRSFYVVKIDSKIWEKISTFSKENYENISVTIERGKDFDVLDGMELAYETIGENPSSITRIIIFAHTEDESLEITFNTKRKKSCCTMSIFGYTADKEKANAIRILAEHLVIHTRASTGFIRISAILYFYTILLHTIRIIDTSVLDKWAVIALFGFSALACFAIDFFLYSPLLEDMIYGRERVQFWTDEERIKKYHRLRRRGWYVGAVLMLVAVVVMLYMTMM